MLPYIICFSISVFFTYLAGNKNIKVGKHSTLTLLFSLLALFPPCFLAATRDSSIGTDVLVYGDKLFFLAKSYSSFLAYYSHAHVELLFGLLTFMVAHISNRYTYYFVLQLLVILPIYKSFFDNNVKKYAWIGMIIYLFWIYPFSLNIMRQSISISLLIWNYKNIKEKKIFKYMVWCAIATGIHITGTIGVLFYVIYFFTKYNYDKESKYEWNRRILRIIKKLNKILIIVGSFIIVILGVKLVELFSSTTGFYTAQLSFKNDGNIDIANILLMIVAIGSVYRYKKQDDDINYIIFLVIIGSILYQLKASLSQMYRISVYFTAYLVLLYPSVLDIIKNKKEKLLLVLLIIALSCVNFGYYIVVRGWHSVYPFVFA